MKVSFTERTFPKTKYRIKLRDGELASSLVTVDNVLKPGFGHEKRQSTTVQHVEEEVMEVA